MRLILGSSSKYRQQVMRDMGLEFEVVTPEIDEKAIRRDDPEQLVMTLAAAKNAAVQAKLTGSAVVITSDQVVLQNGVVLEKPESEAEARRYLGLAGTYPIETVCAIVVYDTATGARTSGLDRVKIVFEPFPPATIDQLIAEGNCYYCAGGFQVEHPLIRPHVLSMEGKIESVMGLSPRLLRRLLDELENPISLI